MNRYDLLRKKAISVVLASGISSFGSTDIIPYELILESALSELVGDRVTFRVLSSLEATSRTELRLHYSDVFVFNQWGLYMLNTSGLYDMGFREHTFPDGMYFSPQEAEEGNIFYNGNLSLAVNNFIVMSNVRTDRFRVFESERERRRQGISAVCDYEQVVLLVGSKNNVFILDLPRKTNWMGSTSRLRLRLNGALLRNLIEIV
jgi:hypothetical protein